MFSYMASAQNIIKGRIVNEQGQGIEYANIIVGNAYTMSNAEGYYELNLSTEKDTFMTISHISYETLHTSIYNHKIINIYAFWGIFYVKSKREKRGHYQSR